MSGSMMATIDAYDDNNLGGTPIQELQDSKSGDRNSSKNNGYTELYNAMQNSQYEGGHNAAHTIHQAQHDPYYESHIAPNSFEQNTTVQPVQMKEPRGPVRPNQNTLSMEEMSELAKDIGRGFEDEIVDTDTEEPVADITKSYISYIPNGLREPLIIVAIFVFLSHPKVKQTIGQYIDQINPTEDCSVPISGIIIYGIILATIYHFVKKYFL